MEIKIIIETPEQKELTPEWREEDEKKVEIHVSKEWDVEIKREDEE